MQSKKLLTAILLLSSFALFAEAQERDSSTLHWRGGLALEKELADIPNSALPLLLAIEIPRGSIVAGENFPIRFVVTNPNMVTLRFPGNGWTLPRLYASTTEEDLSLFVDRSFGANAGEIRDLTLASGESASITVTKVFSRIGPISRNLYAETDYTLRLRGAGAVKTVAIEEPGCPEVVCKWESEEIQIPVRAPTTREREAHQMLLEWSERPRVSDPQIPQKEQELAYIDFYRHFLKEYGDTPYAKQVRVLLFRHLLEPVEKEIHAKVYGNPHEATTEFFPLYVTTVSELINSGLPYASHVDRGVLETLGMARRWDLVVVALDKLLAMNPSERTLDRTFARISCEFVDFPRLLAKGYITAGRETEILRAVAVRCIERCTGWTGYRAVPFDRRTYELLSDTGRWDLLELTANRSLEVAGWSHGILSKIGGVSQSEIDDAEKALRLARKKRLSE